MKGHAIPEMLEDLAKRAEMKLGQGYSSQVQVAAVDLRRLLDACRAIDEAKQRLYAIPAGDEDGRHDAAFALANRVDEMASILDRVMGVPA